MHLPSLSSFLLSSGLLLTLVEAQSVVQVLGATPRQTIDGFGSSIAFMGGYLYNLPAAPRAAIINLLFSQSSGAGFSIVRTRVSPYLFNKSGQFDLNADSEEKGTSYVLSQAKSLGATRFLASVWSPPKQFKTNHALNGGSIDNSATSFSGYADYLLNYVTSFSKTYGINWYAISPQNEPDVQLGDYETCGWDPEDFVSFLGTYMGPRFQQNGVTARILAAEYGQWYEDGIAPTLNNSTSRAAVQIVAAHPYYAGDFKDGGIQDSGYDYFALSKNYNKQLWATEYSNASYTTDSIVESLRVTTLVHKHLTVPESNAFLWWWGATNNADNNGGFGGLITFKASGQYAVRRKLWALGQFARFIRPGWVRVDATAEPTKGVHTSAFRYGSTQVAIVAINENLAASSVKFNFYSLPLSTVAGYRTSSTQNLTSIGNFAVSQGTFTVSLPAQSITTFVGAMNSSASVFPGFAAFITEFNSLVGSSGASGTLLNKFAIGTIDPSNSGYDETALIRQTNTAEYVQYPIPSAGLKSFVLSVQRNADDDGLSFAAVSSSGALTMLNVVPSKPTTQPGDWFVYTFSITKVPAGTKHIRIIFSATNAEWNPRLTRLVITPS